MYSFPFAYALYMNHLSYVIIFDVSLRVCIYFTFVDFLNLSSGGGGRGHVVWKICSKNAGLRRTKKCCGFSPIFSKSISSIPQALSYTAATTTTTAANLKIDLRT